MKIVVHKPLQQQILRECHNVTFVGHVSIHRTTELVDRQFHRRVLWGDVAHYVKTSLTCQVRKLDHHAKAGLLHPLEIPAWKWADVTTDLVTNLAQSEEFTLIAVFVNKLLKMVHLAPGRKEVNAMEYARLFVNNYCSIMVS